MNKTKSWLISFYNRKDLLMQLVQRDIRLKYRRSFLGYLWSIMNPLLIMIILTIVFSNIFRRYNIVNYPIYVIIGRTMFSFLDGSAKKGMLSIINNATLLKKTYVPKYMFPLSCVTSVAVDFVLSLGAIAIVMAFTKTLPSLYVFLFPLTLVQFYFFCIGMTFFLAAVTVFFRDVQYIYNAISTAWMFLSAIFYPASIMPDKVYWIISHFNPFFIYLEQARCFILYGYMPPFSFIWIGCVFSIVSFIIGVGTFYKLQDRFILNI